MTAVQWSPGAAGPVLAAGETVTGWRGLARCKDADPALFFGPGYEEAQAKFRREERARAVCAGCPVTAACLTFALEHGERAGVWGGLNEEERAGLRERPKPGRPKASADRCNAGHRRTPENTRTLSDGRLVCKICEHARYLARKAAA